MEVKWKLGFLLTVYKEKEANFWARKEDVVKNKEAWK